MDQIFLGVSTGAYSIARQGLLSNDGMSGKSNRYVKWVPDHKLITAARIASEKLLRRVGAGSRDPLSACSIIKKQLKAKTTTGVKKLRRAAVEHQKLVKGTTMYPLEHNPGHGLLCTVPT